MNTAVQAYSKSTSDGVWQRPNHNAFSYSDGDEVENRISAIVGAASDLSVLSTELRGKISDWPSNYHLSSQRANLLRPLKECISGSVLEIGSGCGAITRFLGESAHSVVALEGSRRRAQITRSRTRDLDNVEVFCDEFSAFKTQERFDAVTLIGVLEYANMFVGGEEPALNMLTKAKEHLKAQGCLIIAIENQLGLKYFAGAPEDHLGQAMLGLEDKYVPGGVRTYGKKGLTTLLRRAGFEDVEFLYPFPDYKMPTSVLSEAALTHTLFDPTPFLVSTAGKDPQMALEPNFCLERAWPVLAANGLAPDVSNSFLIIARQKASGVIASDFLAWHYTTQRRTEFCKETIFKENTQDSSIEIVRKKLTPPSDTQTGKNHFRQIIDNDAPYSPSPLLSTSLIDIVTRPNWTFDQLAEFLRTYARHLAQIGDIPLITEGQIHWDQAIPTSLFDCIPQNICVHKDGSASAFDLEWISCEDPTFTQLAFRSLWGTLGELTVIGSQSDQPGLSLLNLIQRTMEFAGKTLSTAEARKLMINELEFQQTVTGKSIDFEEVWHWLKEGNLRHTNSQEALHKKERTLGAISAQILQCKQHCNNLEAKITHTQHEHDVLNIALQKESAESLGNSKAIRRLTQQSAIQYIHRRSLKNLIKQLLDYQIVQNKSHSLNSDGPLNRLASLFSLAINYWTTNTKLVIFSHVANEHLAKQMMRQSCHWALPFDWHITAEEAIILETISRTSRELDLIIHTSLQSTLENEIQHTLSLSGELNTLIAIPRVISEHQMSAISDWSLPDAELIRQAYIAMHCDKRIAATYVGISAINGANGSGEIQQPVLCIFRSSDLQHLTPEIQPWRQQSTSKRIREEMDATQLWATSLKKYIVVL